METKDRLSKDRSKIEKIEAATSSVCTLCGQPATQLVDGEPSCDSHVEQIYEHQVEDYTRKHLGNNDWREV